MIPADGGEAERLTEGKNAISSLEWSPDGKHIAFLAPEPKSENEEKKEKDKDDARVVDTDDKLARLWVIELATKKIRMLTDGNWRIAEVRWAPKADRLFVTAAEHPEPLTAATSLFSVSMADGAMKKVYSPPGRVVDLQVSPDGNHVTYLAARGTGPSPHDLFSASDRGRGTTEPDERSRPPDRRVHMAKGRSSDSGCRGRIPRSFVHADSRCKARASCALPRADCEPGRPDRLE